MTEKRLPPQNPLEDLSFSNSVEYPNLVEPIDYSELPPHLRSNSKSNHNNKNVPQPKVVMYNEKFDSASKKALQNDTKYWNSFKGDDNRGIRTARNCPVNQKPNTILSSRTTQDASHQDNKSQFVQNLAHVTPALLNIYKKRGSKQVEQRGEDLRRSKELPCSFKSFEIIHDEGLPGWNISTVGQETEEVDFEEEKDKIPFHELMEGQRKDIEVTKRIFLKNPGIGCLITEGTKKIDRIHKMLEGHRKNTKSTSSYLFPEPEMTETFRMSEIDEEPYFKQENNVFRKEALQPEESVRVVENKENSVKKAVKQNSGEKERLARFGRFSFSSEEKGQSNKKEKKKSRENREGKEPAEWSFTEEPFVESKENIGRTENRKEKVNTDEDELLDSLGSRNDKKSLNKTQREFLSARVNALKDRTSLDNNKQPRPQMSNKAKSFLLEESNRKGSCHNAKENICIAEKSVENRKNTLPSKKNTSGFLSIDMINQQQDFLLKKTEKALEPKTKGSYLKKFLEYKEKRKFKNQAVEPQSHRQAETPKKSFKSSRSSNVSAFTRETISERHSNRQVKEAKPEIIQTRVKKNRNMDVSTGVDSSDVNALTDRSGAQGNLSTPNSKQAAKNGSSGKNTKELRPWQPFDEKTASKNEEKPNQNSLAEQIAKLQLNFVKETKKDKARQSIKPKHPSITQYPPDLFSDHPVLTEEKQSVFAGSINSGSLKTSRGPQGKSLKSSMLSHREGSSSGYELREMLKPKGSVSKNYKDILQTSPNFASCQTVVEDVLAASGNRGQTTQESLLKSFRLRQDMWKKMNRGSAKQGAGDENDDPRTSIYSKSLKWLMNRQQKLEKMHCQEIEDEMRECTFKPQLLAKELSLRADLMNDLSGSVKLFERIVKS